LAELAEYAGSIAVQWALAVELANRDPERATDRLIDAEIKLNHFVRLELADSLRAIRAAIKRFEAELPGDDDDGNASGDLPAR
jgi:hypothetical protein